MENISNSSDAVGIQIQLTGCNGLEMDVPQRVCNAAMCDAPERRPGAGVSLDSLIAGTKPPPSAGRKGSGSRFTMLMGGGSRNTDALSALDISLHSNSSHDDHLEPIETERPAERIASPAESRLAAAPSVVPLPAVDGGSLFFF